MHGRSRLVYRKKNKSLRGDITDNLKLQVTLRTDDGTQKNSMSVIMYSAKNEKIT